MLRSPASPSSVPTDSSPEAGPGTGPPTASDEVRFRARRRDPAWQAALAAELRLRIERAISGG